MILFKFTIRYHKHLNDLFRKKEAIYVLAHTEGEAFNELLKDLSLYGNRLEKAKIQVSRVYYRDARPEAKE